MPTNFELNFDDSGDDVIYSQHIQQFATPTNDLESGAALYRVADGDGTPYEVPFRISDSTDDSGHFLTAATLNPGQQVVFKANVNSPDNASLAILFEDGGSGTLSSSFPLFAGGSPVMEDQIKEDQIVVAFYNDTTSPRFDLAGVGSLDSPVAIENGGTGADSASGARASLGVQAQDDALDQISALSLAKGDILVRDSSVLNKLGAGSNGQVLSADSTEATGLKWVAQSGGATNLDGLSDVVISSPASGQSLRHDGTNFVNAAMGISDITNLQSELDDKQDQAALLDQISGLTLTKGDLLVHDGSAVNKLDSGTNGQILSADSAEATGLKWVTSSPGASNLDGLSDVVISSPTSGQFIRHNGTNFVNASLAAEDMPSSIDATKIGSGAVTNTEFSYLDGVLAPIQTQLNTKSHTSHTHSNLQPQLSSLRHSFFLPDGNGTTISSIGFPVTSVGTATTRNVASTNLVTRARRIGYVSSASAGSLAGIYQATAQYTSSRTHLVCYFAISDATLVSGARMFIGFTASTSAPTNVQPSTIVNSIGLAQLSTDATQFYVVMGGSSTSGSFPFPSGTSVAPALNKLYKLEMLSDETNEIWEVSLKDMSTGTTVSDTFGSAPSKSTFLGFRAWRTNNATASAVGLDITDIHAETYYF